MSTTPPKPSTPAAAASTEPGTKVTPEQVASNSSASAIVNDPNEVLGEFDGGQFMLILSRALGTVAAAVVDNKRKGKITLEFDFAQIPNTQQVSITHSLKLSRPTADGEASEKVKRDTVMHVGKYGKLTVMPESQLELIPRHAKPGN